MSFSSIEKKTQSSDMAIGSPTLHRKQLGNAECEGLQMMGGLQKLFTLARERGLFWTAVYGLRTICLKIIPRLDLCLIRIEKRNFLTGDLSISSSLNTLDQNKKIWNNYDWSLAGDEWTLDAKRYKGIDPDLWKDSLISKIMFKYIRERSSVLEIGPGAGRWTEVLQPVSRRLLVTDISARCLSICKERFGACANVVEQDDSLPHMTGDVISVFVKSEASG